MKEEYKKLIVPMVEALDDEILLQQIYTILIRRKRKSGD